LKLQETPENVPNGEIPRHMQLYVDRYLCDKIVPGNRVTVTGIYSIKKASAQKVNLTSYSFTKENQQALMSLIWHNPLF
jgi:DNA replicative helicase MCM subunit Mcm2 (Cdc46/Mcm family)